MRFEETIHIDLSPESIFLIYKDVNNWSVWDPEVKDSFIAGTFEAGSEGYIKPKSGPKNKLIFTEVTQNKSFTAKTKLPFCELYFEHHLTKKHEGTEVLHTIVFKGALASLWGGLLGNKLASEQAKSMAFLKEYLEGTSN